MASAAYKQKVRAQDALAIHQVQPLLEQLVCELTLTRPADPVAALLARLDELDVHDDEGSNKPTASAAVQQLPPPPSRVLKPQRLVCVYGVRGAGKTTQCAMAAAACNGVTLSPSKLLELAAKDCNSYGEDDKSCVLTSHHTTSNANKTRKRRAVRLPEELQRAVQDVLAHGQQQQQQHVSTELLTRLLVHYVTQLDDARHGDDDDSNSHKDKNSTHAPVTFLLDGYPQTLEQALALEAQLGALSCAIELRCPAATTRRRVTVHSSSLSSPSLAASRNNDNNNVTAAAAAAAAATTAEQSHGDANDEAAVVARVQTLSEYWKARGVRRIVDAAQDTQACARTVRALLNE